MAASVILRIILPVFIAKASTVQYSCRDNQNQFSRRCIIEDVTIPYIGLVTFPNEIRLEFLRPEIPIFDMEIFKLLPYTKHLELRDGYVAEVWFSSPVIETLRVFHTSLTRLEVMPDTNYSLKQLTVNSPVYSRWSTTMRDLKALERIDISHCNFFFITLEWFSSFRNLRILDVSKNKLTSVYSSPGVKLTALKEFYVAGNRLKALKWFPIAFPEVKRIALEDNLWHCEWVTKVREVIFLNGIISMGSDLCCQQGWENHGGLCCKPRGLVTEKNRLKKVLPEDCTTSLIEQQKGSDKAVNNRVVVMDVNNSVVVLNESLTYQVS